MVIKSLFFFDCMEQDYSSGPISRKGSDGNSTSCAPGIDLNQRSAILRREFVKMWAYLLAGWSDYCAFLDDETMASIIFDSPVFLTAASRRWAGKDSTEVNAFLSTLLKTSYFPAFLHDRTDSSEPSGLAIRYSRTLSPVLGTCLDSHSPGRVRGLDLFHYYEQLLHFANDEHQGSGNDFNTRSMLPSERLSEIDFDVFEIVR